MKIPYAWLKTYIPTLPPAQKLADALMMHGMDVEEVIDRSHDFDHVVVGEIVAIQPHPNADKLRLADVIVTPKGKPQEIVCGAPNIAVGQKVAVALIGAKLAKGLTIEKRAIRGVESNGMICAEDELGLGSSHAGIMVLDQQLKPGTPFAKAMGFDQVVFDVTLPANRADLMGMRGVAWEISAMLGRTFQRPNSKFQKISKNKFQIGTTSVQVTVADKKLCPVYTARVIRGVQMTASPTWLQRRLRAAGMRPINAVVDVTNYIMLEYGQPLHAFDAAKIQDGKITVRPARVKETLLTLDGQRRELDPSMLIIADSRGPLAIAGVMGGQDSEVSDGTTDIVLESAIFDPVSIRKTSRRLGLISEASKRFEKGLWPSLPVSASAAAAALIVELCGGTIEKKLVAVGTTKAKPRVISFNPNYVTERLGMTVPAAKCKTILTKLGFQVKGIAKTWKVTVPEWRLDVSIPEDLVDEVGRMVGYEKLPESWPTTGGAPKPIPPNIQKKEIVRSFLSGLGFSEVITHSYYGQGGRVHMGGEHIEVDNPLDKTQQYLRRSLLPNLKKVLEQVADTGHDASVFEIGRVFETTPKFGNQPWTVTIGMCYKPVHGEPLHWKVSGYIHALGLKSPEKQAMFRHYFYKGRVLVWAEFYLSQVNIEGKSGSAYQAEFQTIVRDITLEVRGINEVKKVDQVLRHFTDPIFRGVHFVAMYETPEKSTITARLTFQAPDRTLTKPEVEKAMVEITAKLKDLGAEIR